MYKGRHVYCVLSVLRAVPPFSRPPPLFCPPPPLLGPPLQWCNGGGRWEPEKWNDLLLLTYSLTNVVLLPFPALLHTLVLLLPKSTEMLFRNISLFSDSFAPALCLSSPLKLLDICVVIFALFKATVVFALCPVPSHWVQSSLNSNNYFIYIFASRCRNVDNGEGIRVWRHVWNHYHSVCKDNFWSIYTD